LSMRLVMMGTGSFAEPTFAALLASGHEVVGLFTQPDRPTGKERGSTRQARQGMKEMAVARGIVVYQPESVNTPEGGATLQALKPDLLVVAAYGQILSRDVLATARLGGINVHASLLPRYRGAAPINWAIYHGETRSGVTIIRMSIHLDAGDILAQEGVDIGRDETAGALEERLGPLGAKLALNVIERLARGPVEGRPQDKALVTKAPKLTKEHGLIDWSRTASEVCNQVRAMQPWPTAYTFLHRPGQPPLRLIVQRARIAPDLTICGAAVPGMVRADSFDGTLCAQAGNGEWLEILELQPAGKRRMSAEEFLRGNSLSADARLGSETAPVV
jgi:methionyl-tRNA formyltransferase